MTDQAIPAEAAAARAGARQPAPDTQPRPATTGPVADEALVYVPGLQLGMTTNKTVRGVVARLQTACDVQANTRAAQFSVQWHEGAVHETAGAERVATLLRKDGDDERPVIDVYRYEWSKPFLERWQAQNLFVRAARAVLSIGGFESFLRFFKLSGRKTPFGRAQLTLALAMVVVMVLYAVILLVAVGQTVWQAASAFTDDKPAATSSTNTGAFPDVPPGVGQPGLDEGDLTGGSATQDPNGAGSGGSGSSDNDPEITRFQWVALLGAGVAAVTPKVRRRLEQIGGGLFAANSYLRVASDRPAIVGGLISLVEELGESGQYKNVRIVGYSFGAIVALDTIYPTTTEPVRSLDTVRSLVTVGAPFEFARSVRANWAEGRKSRPGVPGTWLNIYSPIDLLGSNFRTDAQDAPANIAMAPPADDMMVSPTDNLAWNLGVQPTWTNLIEFQGFLSHGQYWGDDETNDHNVFDEVVTHLYTGTPVLA